MPEEKPLTVNPDNPIFQRQKEVVPERESIQQNIAVQTSKEPTQSLTPPTVNEYVELSPDPSAKDLDAVAAEQDTVDATSTEPEPPQDAETVPETPAEQEST